MSFIRPLDYHVMDVNSICASVLLVPIEQKCAIAQLYILMNICHASSQPCPGGASNFASCLLIAPSLVTSAIDCAGWVVVLSRASVRIEYLTKTLFIAVQLQHQAFSSVFIPRRDPRVKSLAVIHTTERSRAPIVAEDCPR